MKRLLSYLKRIFQRHWGKFLTVFIPLLAGIIGTIYYQKSIDQLGEGMKKTAQNLKNNLSKLKKDMEKYLGGGFFNHIPDIAVGIIGFILTYTGKLSIFCGTVIFTPLRYISLYSAAVIVGIFTFINHFLGDEISYFSYSGIEYSYFLNGEFPPQNSTITQYLAGEENMTVKDYREKYYTPDKLYHSYIAHISSYPIYISSYLLNKFSKAATKIVNATADNLKYILLVIAGFMLMYLLIKWRT